VISNKLQNLGVKEADSKVYPRLIVAISGHDQKGKTHFGLTAPDPSVIISSDIGTEGVVHKFKAQGKKIYEYRWSLPELQEAAKKEWLKLSEVYDQVLQEKDIRSIILDTESETWQLLRLYKFGKLEKIPSYAYGEVNAIAARMYKRAYDFQKNLILLRKMKSVYINDKRTAEWEPSGYNDIRHVAQITGLAGREPRTKNENNPDFTFTFTKCRHNPALEGEVLEGPMCNFPFMANMVLPDVDIDFWE